ncbi:MAG: hypothetical protein WC047_01710 [Kiritimatiellales bacterium]
MKELLSIYAILPIVYFMYRAGELAAEKGYRPVKWQLRAYATALFGGFTLPFSICLISLLVNFKMQNKSILVFFLVTLYLIGVLTAGFTLIPHLKDRKSLTGNKRAYRAYDLKNAFLFPRVIPRGGFLWRTISYWILIYLIAALLKLVSLPFRQSAIATLLFVIISLGVACFGLLYFLSHICIPRIRDAGLSRDTFILLFFPGLGQIAFLMLLTTPTRTTGRSSI